ncbi:hypothetical protein BGX27_000346, partial [Mortierella sp. AM989]
LPSQIVFRPQKLDHDPVSVMLRGYSMDMLIQNLSKELDVGIPVGWDRLMHQPITFGTSSIEHVNPSELHVVLGRWGLDQEILGQAINDVTTLVKSSIGETRYVAQSFKYNSPNCQAGTLPICMTTLLVVARHMPESKSGSTAEIGHMYIKTAAEGIQQIGFQEECNGCWLVATCCEKVPYPRDLAMEELQAIQAALSTNQALWAYDHIPHAPSSNTMQSQSGAIDALLRQFVDNKRENEDVFNRYDDNQLLNALQVSIKSRQHKSRNMRMSVAVADMESVLYSLMSECFKTAKINETVEEWWSRVYKQERNAVISLECGSTNQTTEEVIPPETGCISSTAVQSSTKYSWMIISPHANTVDCLFINSDVEIAHLECELLPKLLDGSSSSHNANVHCSSLSEMETGSGGSIARWSTIAPDGSSLDQHYLAEWSQNYIVNKAVMDILRYGSAIAYLRIPFSQGSLSTESLVLESELSPLSTDIAWNVLGNSILGFAKAWRAIVKAFKTGITETSKLKVCLGFGKYEQDVKTITSRGTDKTRFPELVDNLIKMSGAPDDDELRTFMLLITISDNLTWSGETVSYTSTDGFHRFLYFLKYSDVGSNTVDFAFGIIKTDFKLAPDMLVAHRKQSILGGIYESDEIIYRNVPHVITLNDTALLGMYFEVETFRKLAMITNLPVPSYPDLSFLCDRSNDFQ